MSPGAKLGMPTLKLLLVKPPVMPSPGGKVRSPGLVKVFGSGSVITRLVSVVVPLFVISSVYVILLPGSGLSG